jgi:hypothetical protein
MVAEGSREQNEENCGARVAEGDAEGATVGWRNGGKARKGGKGTRVADKARALREQGCMKIVVMGSTKSVSFTKKQMDGKRRIKDA